MDYSETIKTEMQTLLSKMIEGFEVTVEQSEDMYSVHITTNDEAPTLIGHHGETIRAMQKILEVMMFKTAGEPIHILINVNDYREKQKERLEHIATQVADRVQTERRQQYLRGFSSYERKIMHEYITTNHPELTTYSLGEGRDRRLVVDLKENGIPETQEEQ
ncbi:hypothetical protein HGA88_01200 [Candidatus Roizmanbacteria bacterium]|nr:hypothetical protein [Candidatus Roizmanbacteria bacterium]